jgi:hypothetical protein
MSDKPSGKLRVRNWATFQHYKERRPPWIKLHVEILDEYYHDGTPKKFRTLPDNAKLTFLMLLALASRYKDGIIPNDNPAWIARETGLREATVNTLALVECGYLERDASATLADCKHDAPKVLGSETEAEAEGETEGDSTTQHSAPVVAKTIADIPTVVKAARPEYAALSESAIIGKIGAVPQDKYAELIEAVNEWCVDHANALTPFNRPLDSLKLLAERVRSGQKPRQDRAGGANGTQPAWVARWGAIAGYRPSYEVVSEVADYLRRMKATDAEIIAALDAIGEEQAGAQRPQPPTAPAIAALIRQARERGGNGKRRPITVRIDGEPKELDTAAVRAMLAEADAKQRWRIVCAGAGPGACERIEAIAAKAGMEVDKA